MTYRIVHNSRCIIGEGPVWWNDKLWFVDGRTYEVETGRRGQQPYVFGIPN